MGTLTAGQPRLASYCAHKLPTSCRLSSIPECCACADERSHAAAYSTYIDGVGYVLRGSRWQRYCWFCKEFWENRVKASGIQPSRTRIPENPDQTAFLKRWYEFHQGHRVVVKQDGTEERVSVTGEDFRDVSPGCMPRTIEELRQGREQSEFDAPISQTQQAPTVETVTGPSLDEELDRLFDTAAAEQTTEQEQDQVTTSRISPINDVRTAAMPIRIARRNNDYHTRRIAALRRELQRMRTGIERVVNGLRELGENVPNHREATGRLQALDRTLDDISRPSHEQEAQLAIQSIDQFTRATIPAGPGISTQNRIDEARAAVDEARRMRDQAASELASAEQEVTLAQRHVQQLQREQRSTENYIRIFGTREDIAAQGDAYESPIGGMFNRAWERFRAAESDRQEERSIRRYLANEGAIDDEAQLMMVQRLTELQSTQQDVWGVRSATPSSVPAQGIQHQDTSNTTQLMEMARDEVFAGQQSQDTSETASSPTVVLNNDTLQDVASHIPAQQPSEVPLNPVLVDQSNALASDAADTTSHQDVPLPGAYRQEADEVIWMLEAIVRSGGTSGLTSVLRETFGLDITAARRMLNEAESDSRFHERHNDFFEALLADDNLVWRSGLPSHRLTLARTRGHPLLAFSSRPESTQREEQRQNIEAMAEAFMASVSIRGESTLSFIEQSEMLTRLNGRRRILQDRRILEMMLHLSDVVEVARSVLRARLTGQATPQARAQIAALVAQRQAAARAITVSRANLDERRRQVQELYGERVTVARTPPGAQLAWAHRRNVGVRAHSSNDTASDAGEDEVEDAIGLDAKDSGRPEPKTDEEMTIKLECSICYSQIADIACLPCGHLTMCSFCSDQHSPTMRHDRTRPRQPANCPVCRKQIKQKVRVFRP